MIRNGDCVRVPDGRVGRVRARVGNSYRVRVRRMTGNSHQFLLFTEQQLEAIPCPRGWMSRDGYRRYLRVTLAKLRERQKAGRWGG